MKAYSDLYQKVNYSSPMHAVISTNIYEYDIAKANINILLYYGVITLDEFTRIFNMNRMTRQIHVGYILKNKEYSKILSNGLIEFKRRFFEANNIQDNNVLSIKNDAIYLIDKLPTVTKFDNVEFVCKNKYSSFYRLDQLELFYNLDLVESIEVLDIKGISDNVYENHKNFMIDFIKAVCYEAQVIGAISAVNIIASFIENYNKLALPIGFYRELNPGGRFKLKKIVEYSCFYMDYILDNTITPNDLVINHNVLILNQMVAHLINSTKK